MKEDPDSIYEFAGFSVDLVRRRLLRDGIPVQLTAKSFDTLSCLVRHHGSTVTKSELMNAVWSDAAVEENNLTQQISALRRVFGERPNDHRFIVTVPGRGYCFVAPLRAATPKAISRRHSSTLLGFDFDASARRGYSVAACYVLLILLGFAWSTFQNWDRPQSLAVLNFKASTGGDEFIGIGISETLRARLGSVQDLTVRPAPADADALDAGRRMQVDTVVTGSVQRDRDRIRVAVELLDVSDGRIVWGKTFDDAASNIFALQDAIAGEVAIALKVNLSTRGSENHRPLLTLYVQPSRSLLRPEVISV